MSKAEPPKNTRFKPGQSGNPKGREKGSRSKVLVALDALGEGEATDIVKAMVQKAKDGDVVAARIILDRVWPARKGARLQFDLPDTKSADDLPDAVSAINRQIADGEMSPDEGSMIVSVLDAHRKAMETTELANRISALEERISK